MLGPTGAVSAAALLGGNSALAQDNPGMPEPAPPASDLTPDQALELLRRGNEQFLTGGRTSVLTSSQRRLDLAAGQQPFAA